MARRRRDPEMTNVPDRGCAGVSNSCFTCPLPMCRYEHPDGLRGILVEARNAKLLQKFDQGVPVLELVATFDLSERAVYRAIQQKREEAA